jgi:hypothetical protein
MRATWLAGVTGMLTLVVAMVLMAYSAPTQAGQHGTATTQSAVKSGIKP